MPETVIVSALYAEASLLKEHLNLKEKHLLKGFSCFQNPEGNIILVISGTGKIRMAAAVSSALQVFDCDQLILFSSCAGLRKQKPGNTYLIHKVTDLEAGISWYPDLLITSDLPEASLLCGDLSYGVRQKKRDLKEPYLPEEFLKDLSCAEYDLYDMDTSGAVLTAEKFLGPHQITVIKTVTDRGSYVNRDTFQKYMNEGCKNALPLISRLLKTENFQKGFPEDLDDIAVKLHCSATMKAQLKQLYRYAGTTGQDVNTILTEFHEKGIFPCSSREEGKKVLHELGERLTA